MCNACKAPLCSSNVTRLCFSRHISLNMLRMTRCSPPSKLSMFIMMNISFFTKMLGLILWAFVIPFTVLTSSLQSVEKISATVVQLSTTVQQVGLQAGHCGCSPEFIVP